MIKKVALGMAETKTARRVHENVSLAHNQTLYFPNLLETQQGVGDAEGFEQLGARIGDEVIACGLRFSLHFFNKLDRPNVTYRFIIFKYATQVATHNPGLDDNWFWRGTDGAGGEMNRMIDAPNSERIRVVREFFVESTHDYTNANAEGKFAKEKSYLRHLYLPLNDAKIKYNMGNSKEPKFETYGMAVVAYDAFGTALSDVLATFAHTMTFSYKDP